jgi:2-polyprenyl-3-methyl-5-hydroxy-6-metoxy-1,4-benzoquinol methylase
MNSFYHTIAHYYDAENKGKDDDTALYLEVAAEEGAKTIMDVGCGTGRVMAPLADKGYTVHGIDSEAAMLEIAERYRAESAIRQKNMILHLGDVRTYDFNEKVDLMLVPYNGLMHFHHQEEQLKLLKRLREWTSDDGLMVLDLPNAGEVFATPETSALTFERTFLEPESGHMVMQMSYSYLDRTSQIFRVTWVYDEVTSDGTVKRTSAPLVLYYYFYPEVKLLLERSGFEVEAVYGDTEYSPFEDGCERMIIFARPV